MNEWKEREREREKELWNIPHVVISSFFFCIKFNYFWMRDKCAADCIRNTIGKMRVELSAWQYGVLKPTSNEQSFLLHYFFDIFYDNFLRSSSNISISFNIALSNHIWIYKKNNMMTWGMMMCKFDNDLFESSIKWLSSQIHLELSIIANIIVNVKKNKTIAPSSPINLHLHFYVTALMVIALVSSKRRKKFTKNARYKVCTLSVVWWEEKGH